MCLHAPALCPHQGTGGDQPMKASAFRNSIKLPSNFSVYWVNCSNSMLGSTATLWMCIKSGHFHSCTLKTIVLGDILYGRYPSYAGFMAASVALAFDGHFGFLSTVCWQAVRFIHRRLPLLCCHKCCAREREIILLLPRPPYTPGSHQVSLVVRSGANAA
jgi:hypothetical protein